MNAADESVLGTPASKKGAHLEIRFLVESFGSQPNAS